MLILECPECGPRNVQEFRYGGEYNPRPAALKEASEEVWAAYVYMRENPLGVQKEWWYHRAGCGLWFVAERHTKSHEVLQTSVWKAPAGIEAEEADS